MAHAKVSTPDAKATVDQSTYRLYASSTAATPGSPLAANNTSATLPGIGDKFRMRLGVTNTSEPYEPKTFGQVATTDTHTCALASDGWVYCVGYNEDGSLGTGRTSWAVSALTPIAHGDIPTGVTITSIHGSQNSGFVCALASDGWVYCWGDNDMGQLGDGTTTNRKSPVALQRGAIPTRDTIKQIAPGKDHACVITSNDRSYCWGSNADGQLGNSTTNDSTTPVAGSHGDMNVRKAKMISAGGASTCVIAIDDDLAYCWGKNSDGRLGVGDTGTHHKPTRVVQGEMPANFTIKDVTVGEYAMCVIANNNKGYCAGGNSGQLGTSLTTNSDTVRAIEQGEMPAAKTMKKIMMSLNHTCAIGINDRAYCWGHNEKGQLGNNTTTNSPTPVAVHEGGMPSDRSVSMIAMGYDHTCAVTTSDDWAYCWGYNGSGRLADGTPEDRSVPTRALAGAISDGIHAKVISNGFNSACAVADDDWVYCWGWNDDGKLGDGTMTDRMRPAKIAQGSIPANSSIKSVEVGSTHACALADDGWAYCWGHGSPGQLGNGTSQQSSPVKVSQSSIPTGATIKALTAGDGLTCAIASDNWAYCWGRNSYGMLGVGYSGGGSSQPEKMVRGDIPTDATIKSISSGTESSCVVASDNWAYCWGRNYYGSVGDNTTTDRSSPTKVHQGAIPAGVTIKDVTVGDGFTCATASNDRNYCWGDNTYSNFGDNTVTSSNVPVETHRGDIPTGATISSIDAGYDHVCTTAGDNHAYCWGRDSSLQTGWEGVSDAKVPKKITQGDLWETKTVTSIVAGSHTTCLIGSDERAYCFGFNDESGELGNGSVRRSSVPAKVDHGEYNPDHTIEPGALSLKLQYAPKAGATTCSAVSSGWNDVTASSAIGFGSAPPANGTAISAHGNDPAAPTASGFAYQSIVQSGSDFTNSAAISPQKTGLWDFSLADKSNTSNTDYCLRVAPTNPNLSIDTYSQYPQITTALGSLGVQFVNASGTPLVGSAKNTAFSSRVVKLTAQTSTANLTNTTSKQLEVHNSLSNSGWNVSIAATNGPSSTWQSAAHTYKYNSSTANGRLTVGMSSSSVTAHGTTPSGQVCSPTAGITKPTSNTPYQNGTVDAITLLNGSSSTGFNCNWRLRNVLLTQNIPAAQPAGSYSLDMTVTTVAQ